MNRNHSDLSTRRQCALLCLMRSTLYYQPRGESAENLRFMEVIDKQFLKTPWYGSRQMARHMQREGHECGRYRMRWLDGAYAVGPYLPRAQDQRKTSRAQDIYSDTCALAGQIRSGARISHISRCVVDLRSTQPACSIGTALVLDWITRRFPFLEHIFTDAGYQGPGSPQPPRARSRS